MQYFDNTSKHFPGRHYRRQWPAFLLAVFILCTNIVYGQSTTHDIYVSSSASNSVKLFNGETGAFIKDFVAAGSGGLVNTQEVVFGPDGYLYVTGFGNAMIKKYDPQTGDYIEDFSKNYNLVQPAKMTFRYEDSLIYVSQWGGTKKIIRFKMSDGEFVDEFSSTGVNGGCGFAWDADNNMYVAGWGSTGNNGFVQKFDSNGVFQEVFISTPSVKGPVNCWFSEEGKFYVQDWTAGSVERFNADGTPDQTYISNLIRTEGYSWDENGNLFLCDWSRNQIQQYDSLGNYLGVFASGNGLSNPNGIVFGPKYQVVAIGDDPQALPQDFSLHQNYPNPFNPTTNIVFELPAASVVTLDIYDVMGRHVVGAYRNTSLPVGHHKYAWDATDANGTPAASGVYYYRLQTDGFVQTRKMLLVR